MKKQWLAIPVSASLAISGCSSQLTRPLVKAAPIAPEIEAAFITASPCKDAETRGILAPLVGAGVDFALNLVGNWLEAQNARRNAVWSASGLMTACADNSDRLIHVTRAVLDSNGNRMGTAGFDLEGVLSITPDQDGKHLTVSFSPKNLIYGRSAAPAHGSGRKHVVILLALSKAAVLKTSASATGSEEIPGILRIDLGTLRDRKTYPQLMLQHFGATSSIEAAPGDKLNITAIVVESENESLVLKALSDGFNSNKDKLGEALKAALLPAADDEKP